MPVWARSRLFLGPIFVATATLTGAAATRLVLVGRRGMPEGHPTREALGRVESGAMAAELMLSAVNEHRLGRLGEVLDDGRPGRLLPRREVARARRADPAAGPPPRRAVDPPRGELLLPGWRPCASASPGSGAGRASAHDDEAVARMARGRGTVEEAGPGNTVVVVHHR